MITTHHSYFDQEYIPYKPFYPPTLHTHILAISYSIQSIYIHTYYILVYASLTFCTKNTLQVPQSLLIRGAFTAHCTGGDVVRSCGVQKLLLQSVGWCGLARVGSISVQHLLNCTCVVTVGHTKMAAHTCSETHAYAYQNIHALIPLCFLDRFTLTASTRAQVLSEVDTEQGERVSELHQMLCLLTRVGRPLGPHAVPLFLCSQSSSTLLMSTCLLLCSQNAPMRLFICTQSVYTCTHMYTYTNLIMYVHTHVCTNTYTHTQVLHGPLTYFLLWRVNLCYSEVIRSFFLCSCSTSGCPSNHHILPHFCIKGRRAHTDSTKQSTFH